MGVSWIPPRTSETSSQRLTCLALAQTTCSGQPPQIFRRHHFSALHQMLQLSPQSSMASEGTAMERAWATYDIVVAILETMAPGWPLRRRPLQPWAHHRRLNKNALARVARVSRALSGAALDILWRCIDNVEHLIRVVPSCYRHEPNVEDPRLIDNIVSFTLQNAIQCLRYSLPMTHPVGIRPGPRRTGDAFSSFLRG